MPAYSNPDPETLYREIPVQISDKKHFCRRDMILLIGWFLSVPQAGATI